MATVTVTTASRLHFGLYAFGDSPRAFGGVGVMVDRPGLKVACALSDECVATGPLAERAAAFAKLATKNLGVAAGLRVEVLSEPQEHAGLGLGTQLGLSVAAGLEVLVNGQPRGAAELAALVGRGKRSAVGAHGFEHGGWILDGGHASPNAIGELERRLPVPDNWRFVLFRPEKHAGLSGQQEAAAFAALPSIFESTTIELRRLAWEEMAPALAGADFDRFAASLFAYGRLAGECFAPVQGGPFASREVAMLIDTLHASGVAGCGQSSWGPTVFALARSRDEAQAVESAVREDPLHRGVASTIAAPCNTGARWAIDT
ncbi:MAG: hypothetical protein AAF589_07300 [Planctomycetota bacterium]